MSERASPSLSESVWSLALAGALGEAFSLLWETADESAERKALRANLQAYCGNEGAALAVASTLPKGPARAEVRARVAVAREDWEACRRHCESCEASPEVAALQALAHRALGQESEVERFLERAAVGGGLSSWTAALIEARRRSRPDEAIRDVAERARAEGALLAEAEAWTELFDYLRDSGDQTAAPVAAARALERWEQLVITLPPPLRAGFWSPPRRQAVREASRLRTEIGANSTTRSVRALLQTLRQLATERDRERLLERITDGAITLSGAERGFVLLVDDSGQLEPTTVRVAEARLGSSTAAFSRSIAETVLIDGEPVVTVDAALDARVRDYMSVHQLMLKSVACLPIETRGRTWGVLYLEHRSHSGRFSGDDLALLRAFADQAAIAIETAALIERVESQKEELERANQALIDANAHLEARLEGQSEALERTRREISNLRGGAGGGESWGLIGQSDAMRRVVGVIERLANNHVPVVVTGESGTGKELVAKAIHEASARKAGPFVSLSCGAIPDGLLESELFGHVAGAFTGATRARDGVFVQASGGTLFMDELADMPPRMQLDLLRVLQESRVRPVGASDERPVDVRVVAASKRPLRELVQEGLLREDRYYRLSVVELELPPLRERRADIPLLSDHILDKLASARGEPKKRLSAAAHRRLMIHGFPGNVRELEHALMNASVFAKGPSIEAEDLTLGTEVDVTPSPDASESYRDYKDAERDRILQALNVHGWNRARAARALGIPRRTFYRRLKQHQIELPES